MAIEVITMHPPTALALAAEKPKLGISVNILAKNCAKNLKECLESLKDFVRSDRGDEIVVVDTGSIDETPTVAEEWGARVFRHPELSSSDFLKTLQETFPTEYEENKDAPFLKEGLMVDFAKARNLAMEHSKNDLIFWIDSDDVLKGAKELRDFCLQFFEAPGNKIFHMPYDYHFDEDGYVTCILWRERAFRKGLYEWKGVCHECVVPLKQSDIQLNRMPGETARILHKNFSGHKAADIRNYLIMKTAYEKAEWKDPRLEIYLGNACRGLERWRESIHWYTLGMMRSGSKDDRYHCAVNIATTYTVLARPWRALDFFFQAIKINPTDPRAYYGIARSFYDLKKWNECLIYTGIAREMGPPRTLLAVDPGSLDYFPMFFEAQCLKELRRPGAALSVVEQIMALRPNCKESKLIYDEITNWAREDKIKETLGPLGLLAFSDQGFLEIMERIRPEIRRKYRDLQMESECHDEKAVAFLCPGDANGNWDGKSFDSGIGGSEKMVIQIARGLAKRGWAVDVYANPKEENCYKKIDGVWWRPFQSYNPLLRRDCAILWRSPNLLEYVKRARRILVDLHDVPDFADLSSPEYDRIDGFVWKSKYHRQLAKGCPESKCVYGRNGISPELFTQEVKRNYKKIIWTSSGDRGLRIALAAWDLVREHIPDAEFHVFYGFTDFYHKVASQKEYNFMGDCGCERHMMDYLEECMTMIDAMGVNYHGMLPSKELAKHILEAGVWLYPTKFPEISCINAMEAQAGGAMPVCSDYAALKETVRNGVIVNPLDYRDIASKVISVIKAGEQHDEYRKSMMAEAAKEFDIDGAVDIWERELLK